MNINRQPEINFCGFFFQSEDYPRFAAQQARSASQSKEAQYPRNYLQSLVQRQAIKNSLADPLVVQGRSGVAFRISWKEDQVWSQILLLRSAYDKLIKNMDGVVFVISSICGLMIKAANMTGKTIGPAIGYWVVLESIDPRAVVRYVQEMVQGQAEVKLLQEPPLMTTLDTIHNTMCTVFKDHSTPCIKRRIVESQMQGIDAMLPNGGFATRLVPTSELDSLAKLAKPILDEAGVYVDIVTY